MIIENRKGQNIVVCINGKESHGGLAFVMHGLGGFKEQPHIQTLINTLKKNNYIVVSFDTTNTLGESDGNYSDATATNYLEDLEDVINWAKNCEWYQEPFILSGYSLGGLAVSVFAEKYPETVKALALFSTVISGELWRKIQNEKMIKDWKRKKVLIRKGNVSNQEMIKILKWTFVEDIMKHDLMENINKLTMPVLLIVGSEDLVTPISHQEIFFEKLPGKKKLYVIDGAEHVFKENAHLDKASNLLAKWINSII